VWADDYDRTPHPERHGASVEDDDDYSSSSEGPPYTFLPLTTACSAAGEAHGGERALSPPQDASTEDDGASGSGAPPRPGARFEVPAWLSILQVEDFYRPPPRHIATWDDGIDDGGSEAAGDDDGPGALLHADAAGQTTRPGLAGHGAE